MRYPFFSGSSSNKISVAVATAKYAVSHQNLPYPFRVPGTVHACNNFFEHPFEHVISHFYRIPFMEETLINIYSISVTYKLHLRIDILLCLCSFSLTSRASFRVQFTVWSGKAPNTWAFPMSYGGESSNQLGWVGWSHSFAQIHCACLENLY